MGGQVPARFTALAQDNNEIAVVLQGPTVGPLPFNQIRVVVDLAASPYLTIALPEHFSLLAAADALYASLDRVIVYDIGNCREVAGLVADLLLRSRTELLRHADILHVMIPFAMEGQSGFASGCRLVCNDTPCDLRIEAGTLTAEILTRRLAGKVVISLRTPDLVRPMDLWSDSTDPRWLGLAVRLS